MERLVQPEILDQLSPTDPRALRSRRDLERVNGWMGNARIVADALEKFSSTNPPKRIADLGAGDGKFSLGLAQQLSTAWREVEVVLVDCKKNVQPETSAEFRRLGWKPEPIEADVFDWLRSAQSEAMDVIIANLFLHHFIDEQLNELFHLIASRTKLFIACEPRRTRIGLVATRLLWAIGCSDITRHDAFLSVRAGFHDGELSALWPQHGHWELIEKPASFASHLLAARSSHL